MIVMDQIKSHGGKRQGAGRKPKPPKELHNQVFSLKLTLDEKLLLDQSYARDWARDELVNLARQKLDAEINRD